MTNTSVDVQIAHDLGLESEDIGRELRLSIKRRRSFVSTHPPFPLSFTIALPLLKISACPPSSHFVEPASSFELCPHDLSRLRPPTNSSISVLSLHQTLFSASQPGLVLVSRLSIAAKISVRGGIEQSRRTHSKLLESIVK